MSEASTRPGRKHVLVAGASGTIGQTVVRALVNDGHRVVALLREGAPQGDARSGAQTYHANVTDPALSPEELGAVLTRERIDTVISCLASRTGAPKDAEAVDYRANSKLLQAGEAAGVGHFILLSAICVQKPRLAFQHAKLKFEAELRESSIEQTIVRPTAFFKSLSGQIGRVAAGKPFLLFGDGELTRCKPISDQDLARFIADCVESLERRGKILPIGGPGPAISPREQGAMLFELSGKEPRFRSVNPALFPIAARILSLGAPLSGWCAEKAEYARIAHYYATESMLVFDDDTNRYSAEATPEFGADTLAEHYRAALDSR